MLAIALVLAGAPQWGPSDLQPTAYTSPSGTWELFVDPLDRTGRGPSRCRSSRSGVEAWSAELPFTFQAAVMDERGIAAGYAFTEGHAKEGQLLVVILSETGQPVFEERIPQRENSSCYSFSADPNVLGLLPSSPSSAGSCSVSTTWRQTADSSLGGATTCTCGGCTPRSSPPVASRISRKTRGAWPRTPCRTRR